MIRQMNKNDKKELDRVCQIWCEVSCKMHNFFDDYENFWFKKKGDFLLDTIDSDGYVCEEDGRIKGFVTIKNTYIRELFVDSSYQKQGIGTILLDLAKQCFSSLFLHVYVRNYETINWYFKRGFVITRIHDGESRELGEKHLKYEMAWRKSTC
jgi:putative acetyltransferase